MKIAFSLFLHEYVNSENIGYEDCKTFQTICAVCKEPVFKVSRETYNKKTDYFSHYQKDKTLNKQCELRANQLSKTRIEEVRTESRNQKLHLFLKVFQDIVWKNEYNENTRKKARHYFFMLGKSQTLSTLYRGMLVQLRDEIEEKGEIFDMFDESLENIYQNSIDFNSNYAINLQKEFAFDFLQHLLAGHSKINLFFLFNHATIKVVGNLEKKNKMDELLPWEEVLLGYLQRFLKTQNEKKRMDIITQMANHKIISSYSHQEADLFIMFGSSLQYNSFGILLRMPYLHLLDELKPGTPP